MTRERAKELLPIIKAYIDGEEIEFRRDKEPMWVHVRHPDFFDGFSYRVKPKTYKVGQRFQADLSENNKYILAHIGCNQVILISLSDGNRFSDHVSVIDSSNISEDEFNEICNYELYNINFKLIK